MLNKKGFTLAEILISLSLISIVYFSFPTILKLFVNTVFLSENKNLEDINKIYQDLEKSFYTSFKIKLSDDKSILSIYRKDSCIINFKYIKDNSILERYFECDLNYDENEVFYIVKGISLFDIEEINKNKFILRISSEYDSNFIREYIFTK